MTTTPPPLSIDPTFLQTVQTALNTLAAEAETQLRGVGSSTYQGNTRYVPPVNEDLSVDAGGPVADSGGNSGSGGFSPATDLNAQLATVGGEVFTNLTTLRKTWADLAREISTVLSTWSNTEDINTESVSQLLTQFPATVTDLNGTSSSAAG
jgi:hypothetical protein